MSSCLTGHVDKFGRALVTVAVGSDDQATRHPVEVWIDTGFNGDLVLSNQLIENLKLKQSGTIKAVLADGSATALERYVCVVDWLGERRELEVVANEGEYPLLGVGLLVGCHLSISYKTCEIAVTK